MDIRPLRNLNNLGSGIHKHWIWGSETKYYRSCAYLQKINYSIQDLNRAIDYLEKPTMKEVIFIITLVDWIGSAVFNLRKMLIGGMGEAFIYSKQSDLDNAYEYISAIRSFLVAHPLSTTKHTKFGFDGDKICIDVTGRIPIVERTYLHSENWSHYYLDHLELNDTSNADFYMIIYSEEKNQMQFMQYIGANFSDLYFVAELYIDKLYELDNYLGKQKKKDWL